MWTDLQINAVLLTRNPEWQVSFSELNGAEVSFEDMIVFNIDRPAFILCIVAFCVLTHWVYFQRDFKAHFQKIKVDFNSSRKSFYIACVLYTILGNAHNNSMSQVLLFLPIL